MQLKLSREKGNIGLEGILLIVLLIVIVLGIIFECSKSKEPSAKAPSTKPPTHSSRSAIKVNMKKLGDKDLIQYDKYRETEGYGAGYYDKASVNKNGDYIDVTIYVANHYSGKDTWALHQKRLDCTGKKINTLLMQNETNIIFDVRDKESPFYTLKDAEIDEKKLFNVICRKYSKGKIKDVSKE